MSVQLALRSLWKEHARYFWVVACVIALCVAQSARAEPADLRSPPEGNGLGGALASCISGPPTQSSVDSCTHLIEFGEHTPNALSRLYAQRAKFYLRLHLNEAAFADFTEAIRVAPRQVSSYFWRGNAYFEERDYARALVDFDRAGEIDRREPSILNMRCRVRAVMGQDLQTARRLCDQALIRQPNRPAYLDSRGLVELRAQRFDRAWSDYDAAFRWSPENAHALYGRGIAALRLGRTEEGRADIARALLIDSHVCDAYAGYGVSP